MYGYHFNQEEVSKVQYDPRRHSSCWAQVIYNKVVYEYHLIQEEVHIQYDPSRHSSCWAQVIPNVVTVGYLCISIGWIHQAGANTLGWSDFEERKKCLHFPCCATIVLENQFQN